jgi:hypothetical protein
MNNEEQVPEILGLHELGVVAMVLVKVTSFP